MKTIFFFLPAIAMGMLLPVIRSGSIASTSPLTVCDNPSTAVTVAVFQPGANERPGKTHFDPLVTDILTFTNKARQRKGLKPLAMNEALNDIARGHSQDMATGKVPFSHDGFKDRYNKARTVLTDIRSFAENVSFGPHTGKEAVEGWMDSKHHRENILGNYTSIGIGVAADAKGVQYFTQVFCR